MSHHIYQTKAFILGSTDTGEANKMISLFTRDLGLIYTAAQGVRLMKSKLRPSIQDLSFSKVSVVRGKEVWRLTNAEKLISLTDKRIALPIKKMSAEVLFFVRRLVQGEERHIELFEFLSTFFEFVLKNTNFATEHTVGLMLLAKVAILHELGYGSDEESIRKFIFEFTPETVKIKAVEAESCVKELKTHIDRALESSHL